MSSICDICIHYLAKICGGERELHNIDECLNFKTYECRACKFFDQCSDNRKAHVMIWFMNCDKFEIMEGEVKKEVNNMTRCEACRYFEDCSHKDVMSRNQYVRCPGFETNINPEYLKNIDHSPMRDIRVVLGEKMYEPLSVETRFGSLEDTEMDITVCVSPRYERPSYVIDNSAIKNVIFNPPATIILWDDGTKTVVKTQGDDVFDPEKGFAMAVAKKTFGNKGSYYNEVKKWCEPWYEKESAKIMDAINHGWPFNIWNVHYKPKDTD